MDASIIVLGTCQSADLSWCPKGEQCPGAPTDGGWGCHSVVDGDLEVEANAECILLLGNQDL